MTNLVEEAILNASYGNSVKEILDMVMAAEKAFNDYGKVSILFGDKGEKSAKKFEDSLIRSVHALVHVGKIKDPYDTVASMNELNSAMRMVRRAYPNWPKAYRYWDDFYNAFDTEARPSSETTAPHAITLQQTRTFAEQGDPVAQYKLGTMCAEGQGVTQDYQEALKWFQLSAAQGNPEAQANLGALYHAGFGVQEDYVQAMMWYMIAKANGTSAADQNLQQLESISTTAQISQAKGMARLWRLAVNQRAKLTSKPAYMGTQRARKQNLFLSGKRLWVIIAAPLVLIISFYAWNAPTDYPSCLLKELPGTENDTVAIAKASQCAQQFSQAQTGIFPASTEASRSCIIEHASSTTSQRASSIIARACLLKYGAVDWDHGTISPPTQ